MLAFPTRHNRGGLDALPQGLAFFFFSSLSFSLSKGPIIPFS